MEQGGMHSKWVWSINHDLITSLRLNHTLISLKSNPTWQKRNTCIRVDTYAHLQHIKVLKHFEYMCYGCVMHSKLVWSINHDLTTSLRLNHTLNSLKSNPTWHKSNTCVRVDPYAHVQHIKVLKHLPYI